jgi:hypothetical protein
MSIKQLAIFVEGKTELLFIKRLLIEIAGIKNIEIQCKILQGQGRCPEIERFTDSKSKYKILLYNSCADNRVLSDMKDNYMNLIFNKGYSKILGIRDLYPKSFERKNRIIESIQQHLDNEKLDKIRIIIAVMEIETWFIGELTHYTKIDPELTLEHIKENLIDLENLNDIEKDISHPAGLLHKIYQLKGKAWKKTERHIHRTVNNLDYENLYIKTRNNIPSLNQLIIELDDFFS